MILKIFRQGGRVHLAVAATAAILSGVGAAVARPISGCAAIKACWSTDSYVVDLAWSLIQSRLSTRGQGIETISTSACLSLPINAMAATHRLKGSGLGATSAHGSNWRAFQPGDLNRN